MGRLSSAMLMLAAAAVLTGGAAVLAQTEAHFDNPAELRRALMDARKEAEAARIRGERLEADARAAREAAKRTATEAAALAARIQQSEAGIAAAQARMKLIADARAKVDRRLAERREPLVRLTGALQQLSRRPLALSALRPRTVRETVYLRALLDNTIPQVQQRTAALRTELERVSALEREAKQALDAFKESESALESRRTQLAALETRQRLASRERGGEAYRESERALALAEQARDLDSLVDKLDEAGSVRKALAALDGPLLRPDQPDIAGSASPSATPGFSATPSSTGSATPGTGSASFTVQLPVTGRTVTGFGAETSANIRSKGLTLAPRERAQIVAPAAGRVAFAGPYRGYGRIVIIEHEGGWTSLITGMARDDVAVGDELLAGAPIGIAAPERPSVDFELRKDGKPVNPLEYVQ